MSDEKSLRELSERDRDTRDTIVKSTLTGVASAALAVTMISPAGLGGVIGTSLASGLGIDPQSSPNEDIYANLPPYPAPLTADEVSDIRGQLASTAASLEITRAATEARIEHMRALASNQDSLRFAAQVRESISAQTANATPQLRLERTGADAAVPVDVADAQPVAPAQVAELPRVQPASLQIGGVESDKYSDRHLAFASLLLDYSN